MLVGYLATGAEIAAVTVIGGAVIRGIGSYLRQMFSRSRHHFDAAESIRLQLGRVLALGLKFTVTSDILRTAVAPTRQDILNLGAIVLLRTLLNCFLEREIQQGEQRHLPQRSSIEILSSRKSLWASVRVSTPEALHFKSPHTSYYLLLFSR